MKKRALILSALVAFTVAGCSSSKSPDDWKTLDDIGGSIREAGGICDPIESTDGAQGTCGDDNGYYMLSINSDEYPDVAYAQRYAAETNDTEVPIVTLWGKEWAITCVHNAEANCASIKAHIGDVDEYTSQPVNDDSSDLRRRLEALAPINQVTPDNLKEKCIMAIHDEIPDAGDFDFPTPVDLGAPDQATIYSDGGDFRYEVSEDEWNDAAYFCTVYTEDETITEATAIVVG